MADHDPATAAAAGTIQLGGDLTVHRLGFGAMRVTGDGVWGPPSDLDQARAVLRRAIELGVDFIDTADSYGPDISETLIAEALFPYPDDLVIATKGGLERPGPGRWDPNGAPDHLVSACEGSLARLRLEQIPLYQFHRPDPRVPLEESVGALVELKEQGKIRHIGLSNVDADQLRRAQRLTPVVSVQNRYNLTDRSSESMVDLCEQQGIAFLPWAPIQEADAPVVSEIAARHHASERQVTLAWLLARSSVMLPIPGTGSAAHLEDNVAAAGLRLADDEIAALDAAGNNESRLRRTLKSARSSVRSRTSRGGGSSAR
jgi:pyridoxine 4-dehydrogenase